ncbi:MAG: hypothetical protein Q9227_008326 [Pyrenula ochraceoflavens]
MVQVDKYFLAPTRLIPNSPQPLLHYKALLSESDRAPAALHELLDKNDWITQWIFRYGPTQLSHYHSQTHECMTVLSGTATIRFGVADTDADDLDASTWGDAQEEGGLELRARPGDLFIIPAGVAHKTYNTSPRAEFTLLTPGQGHGIQASNVKEALAMVELSGFTMMGAYPKNCAHWDFSTGAQDTGNFEISWKVPKPEKDPVLGTLPEGLVTHWKNDT